MALGYAPKPYKPVYAQHKAPVDPYKFARSGSENYWQANGADAYGTKSAYGQGLSREAKLSAIKQLTGSDFDANTAKYSTYHVKNPMGLRLYEAKAPGRYGIPGMTQAEADEKNYGLILDDAYNKALGSLYQDRDITEEEAKAGGMDFKLLGERGKEGKWVERINRLTGEKEYAPVKTKDKDMGSNFMSRSWRNNKDEYITGGGAVLGGILGSIVPGLGTVYGAALGASLAGGAREAHVQNKESKKAKAAIDGQIAAVDAESGGLAAQLRRRRVRRGGGEAVSEYETETPNALREDVRDI